MAITYIDFVPSSVTPPTYQVTLDGETYTLVCTWSIAGQRYYINLYDLSGALVLCEAMVGSPTGFDLASLTWKNGIVTATTQLPHKIPVGTTLNLTIAGATPDAYNGLVECMITGPSTFTYSLSANPGESSVPGTAQQNINLVGQLFTSTLVFRQANMQFEVT